MVLILFYVFRPLQVRPEQRSAGSESLVWRSRLGHVIQNTKWIRLSLSSSCRVLRHVDAAGPERAVVAPVDRPTLTCQQDYDQRTKRFISRIPATI